MNVTALNGGEIRQAENDELGWQSYDVRTLRGSRTGRYSLSPAPIRKRVGLALCCQYAMPD